MTPRAIQHAAFRYALAVLAVVIALGCTKLLKGAGDSGISPLFFAAVLLAAWYGGLGPGLLATFLSGIATAHLLTTPQGLSLASARDHVLRLVVFTIVALLTSSLHAAMRRAAEESRKAREAAESASAAKSRFLAMVSHELRTPLSPVLIVADMLENDPSLSERVRKDIGTIRRNVDLEIRLIEDLVDLTRIAAGKMDLRTEIVPLHEPLLAALRVCEGDAREKEIDLSIQLLPESPHIVGDPVRLQQIFWNLFRNAIKFTPQGGRISVITRNQGDGRTVTEISDNGIGIDPAQLHRIFEAFEQGEPDIQVRFGGLGLGLAICQALAEAHQGTIQAASEGRGRGASFIVAFPIATNAASAICTQREDAAKLESQNNSA